jgi:hypothetical protein
LLILVVHRLVWDRPITPRLSLENLLVDKERSGTSNDTCQIKVSTDFFTFSALADKDKLLAKLQHICAIVEKDMIKNNKEAKKVTLVYKKSNFELKTKTATLNKYATNRRGYQIWKLTTTIGTL